ncbi:MAG: hypothetical protein AUK47_12600 [Deltaproteobacteria bacterium CG2_30_63_29]|nr:MAG: hypothetical protein AUK47_12600 [Deltaproteobacteria bacterium CG2_30_63_29]
MLVAVAAVGPVLADAVAALNATHPNVPSLPFTPVQLPKIGRVPLGNALKLSVCVLVGPQAPSLTVKVWLDDVPSEVIVVRSTGLPFKVCPEVTLRSPTHCAEAADAPVSATIATIPTANPHRAARFRRFMKYPRAQVAKCLFIVSLFSEA